MSQTSTLAFQHRGDCCTHRSTAMISSTPKRTPQPAPQLHLISLHQSSTQPQPVPHISCHQPAKGCVVAPSAACLSAHGDRCWACMHVAAKCHAHTHEGYVWRALRLEVPHQVLTAANQAYPGTHRLPGQRNGFAATTGQDVCTQLRATLCIRSPCSWQQWKISHQVTPALPTTTLPYHKACSSVGDPQRLL